jgi:hypothetical protein
MCAGLVISPRSTGEAGDSGEFAIPLKEAGGTLWNENAGKKSASEEPASTTIISRVAAEVAAQLHHPGGRAKVACDAG